MKKRIIITSLVALAAAGAFWGFSYIQAENKTSDEGDKMDMPDLTGWPETAQKAAKEIETKYGKPNGVTPDMIVWNNNGIWLKTIVYKKEMKHDFPHPHMDVVEQWINYRVPLNLYDDIAMYDGSVTVNRTNGTISARCDKEAMNMLALNLAYDIANSNKNIDDARNEYGKNATAFMKGEKPAYTQKLNFTNDKMAPDMDKTLDVMKEKMNVGGGGQ